MEHIREALKAFSFRPVHNKLLQSGCFTWSFMANQYHIFALSRQTVVDSSFKGDRLHISVPPLSFRGLQWYVHAAVNDAGWQVSTEEWGHAFRLQDMSQEAVLLHCVILRRGKTHVTSLITALIFSVVYKLLTTALCSHTWQKSQLPWILLTKEWYFKNVGILNQPAWNSSQSRPQTGITSRTVAQAGKNPEHFKSWIKSDRPQRLL